MGCFLSKLLLYAYPRSLHLENANVLQLDSLLSVPLIIYQVWQRSRINCGIVQDLWIADDMYCAESSLPLVLDSGSPSFWFEMGLL